MSNLKDNKKNVLEVVNVSKEFTQGEKQLKILNSASLTIKAGEIVALVGPSGSGKSTFLQIAGLLDKADSGTVIINGQNASDADDNLRTKIRGREIGVVYQFHHLLPEFSALENVIIPQMLNGVDKKTAIKVATELLQQLGLSNRILHRPAELSGGEQQRVAIARGIVNNPALLLADEPTGNLDPHTAEEVFELLLKVSMIHNIAILFVTHNLELAKRANIIAKIYEGKIEV